MKTKVANTIKDAAKTTFYDQFADEFDQRMNLYDLETRINMVFNELLPSDLKGKRLLDVGCGTGFFSQKACSKGAIVISMDVGERLLRRVAQKCESTLVIGSVLNLGFSDASFDLIICSEVIEHTEEPFTAVKELFRVLKPGGTLALTVPNRFWKWSCVLANALRLRPYKGYENWVGYYQLLRVLKRSGFMVMKYFGFHLFPFQVGLFHPLLRKLDRWGAKIGYFYINIGARCQKLT